MTKLPVQDKLNRLFVEYEYYSLAQVLDRAIAHAQNGKGKERHASEGECFVDQQIVQLGEWMGSGGSTHFNIGQACKKSIESTRLDYNRAISELLGAINYLAGAVMILDRQESERSDPGTVTSAKTING